MLLSLGVTFKKDEIQHVFSLVDIDGGGEIELEEFQGWFDRARRAPRARKRRGSLEEDSLADLANLQGGFDSAQTSSSLVISVAQTKETTS